MENLVNSGDLADFLDAHGLPGKDAIRMVADIHTGELSVLYMKRDSNGDPLVIDGDLIEETVTVPFGGVGSKR